MDDNKQGFTFIELLVVLAILSVLFVLVLPDYAGWTDRSRLKRAARDLVSVMKQCRIGAVESRTDWRITFDTGNNSYQITDAGRDRIWENADDNSFVNRVFNRNEAGRDAVARGFPRDVEFGTDYGSPDGIADAGDGVTANGNRLEFNSTGTASAGSVFLKNDDADSFVIIMNSSGRIRMLHNYGHGWGE